MNLTALREKHPALLPVLLGVLLLAVLLLLPTGYEVT